MRLQYQPPWPIDVVYSWCGLPENEHCKYTEDLKYSMRSVHQNIPWHRKIVLVVQDDFIIPFWMKKHVDKKHLKIVRLRDIIPSKYLPTHNGHVIQSWLFRIPGLSERFLFLHDDMYILRPAPWTEFFDAQSGKPINRHHPGPPDHGLHPDHRIPYVRMWVAAITKYGIHNTRIQQNVLPYTKTHLQKYYKKFKNVVNKSSKERLYTGERDFDLLRFTTSLTTSSGEAIHRQTDTTIDYFAEANDVQQIKRLLVNKPMFVCINNSSPIYSHVYDTLQKLFPRPSPFEEN